MPKFRVRAAPLRREHDQHICLPHARTLRLSDEPQRLCILHILRAMLRPVVRVHPAGTFQPLRKRAQLPAAAIPVRVKAVISVIFSFLSKQKEHAFALPL